MNTGAGVIGASPSDEDMDLMALPPGLTGTTDAGLGGEEFAAEPESLPLPLLPLPLSLSRWMATEEATTVDAWRLLRAREGEAPTTSGTVLRVLVLSMLLPPPVRPTRTLARRFRPARSPAADAPLLRSIVQRVMPRSP
jgi:hypothetical protein